MILVKDVRIRNEVRTREAESANNLKKFAAMVFDSAANDAEVRKIQTEVESSILKLKTEGKRITEDSVRLSNDTLKTKKTKYIAILTVIDIIKAIEAAQINLLMNDKGEKFNELEALFEVLSIHKNRLNSLAIISSSATE
jgi:hypothetical protein